MSLIKRNGHSLSSFPSLLNHILTKDLLNWDVDNNSLTGTTIPAVNIGKLKTVSWWKWQRLV